MSTPITHESSSHSLAEDAEVRDQSESRRQITGLIVGIALAVLIYFIFPASAVDTVLSADPELETNHASLRITAAIAVLMGAWWMTEAIPLASTALVPLAAFPLFPLFFR
ncbi:Sodium-dependent dicarboxylate transporter sdcS [Corynebacterium kutscheri]|uniref:Sodium-dependent dicarboxylate transporter sdcS n=1 Tax=Corynebacterium kutscheri TaxID=35755 RepID=A0AB38VUS5_9CORY|nr:Sodium-dependent dicarboxylate transporter sdcS [Corynebacterium kutscheri]